MKYSVLGKFLFVRSLEETLKNYEFKRVHYKRKNIVTQEQLKGLGNLEVLLTSSMNNSATQIMKEFGATESGVITRIPEEYEVLKTDDVTVIKYGKGVELSSLLIAETKYAGIVCGFDENHFIICSSKEYEFVLEELVNMIKPGKCKFAIKQCYCVGKTFSISQI